MNFLVPWFPRRKGQYGDLLSITDELDRFFNEGWRGLTEKDFLPERAWSPAVDLYETDENLMVKAELPGLDKKDIKLTLSDGLLTISGEKKHEKETKRKNYRRLESSYGSFQRVIEIPVPVQADKVKADYKRGVLEITLPKAEEAKSKAIQIDVN